MALTTRDVITQDFVRDTVEEIVERDLIYRQVFRQIDATNVQSNSYTFQIETLNEGMPELVGEGEEAPRGQSHEEDNEVTVHFEKFMGEVALTMEAMEDGLVDLKAREIEQLAQSMARRLNERAYETIVDNHITAGDGDGTFTFSDVIQGTVAIRGAENQDFEPDTLIVDLNAYQDLMADDNFNRATAAGDEVVRSGEVGRVAGLDVVIDTQHDFQEEFDDIADTGGAFMFDSDNYGYELTRTQMSTREYEEPERQADVVQTFCRKAWAAINEEAVVLIDG